MNCDEEGFINEAERLFFAGNRLMDEGDYLGAEQCFRRALTVTPNFPEALVNLGWLRTRARDGEEAEACYRQAIGLHPGVIQPRLLLGVLLMDGKRFEAAEVVYRQALRVAPEAPEIWSNLGVLLACLKREQEAEHCYRTALALDDSYGKARFNLSYVLLRQGRFAEGWLCLEARDWYGYLARHFTFPRWQGEPLAGRSLFIGCEAGHGDMIQFCRYVSVLKQQGAARIALLCHPGLKHLLASLHGVDELFSLHDEVPRSGWDFWTPPLSLPFYCQTRLDTIPAELPYLYAESASTGRWSKWLSSGRFRIGLVWKGSAQFENDADRSLPSLATLAPLASLSGIQWVSLQKGQGEDQARQPPVGLDILPLGETLEDFADTAGLVSCLDLIISVDTGVAHLAGALGKPCWVLLPDYRTDWRWLVGRVDSPWYPGVVRLFRQASAGDWPPVIASVVEALGVWMAERDGSVASADR